MQDRFKFNFWDTKEKVIIDWDCICQTAFNCTQEEGNKIQRYGLMYWVFTTPSRFIPLQCTGLKDKNGKLIFEGDILSINRIRKAQVVFRTGAFFVQFSKKYHSMGVGGYDASELEVIGQIYLNPELLTEEVQA